MRPSPRGELMGIEPPFPKYFIIYIFDLIKMYDKSKKVILKLKNLFFLIYMKLKVNNTPPQKKKKVSGLAIDI